MKRFLTPLFVLFILVLIALSIMTLLSVRAFINNESIMTALPTPTTTPEPKITQTEKPDIPTTTIVVENLDTPWAIAFLPELESSSTLSGQTFPDMLITERKGAIRILENGFLDPSPVATISSVREIGEGGLMGIALHPNFENNNYIYLYYTYAGDENQTLNRVVKMTYADKTLQDEQIIVDAIPGAPNHNGGRIKFGPDGYLYITTGDAQNPSLAQNTDSLAGKILRVTDEGQPASGNPFENSVYTYGHRNPQGIAWDVNGNLWSTEHGRSGALSGLDEINLIEPGRNYGWDIIQGSETNQSMQTPVLNSGTDTWAPAGADFIDNSIFFAGLRGQTLYEGVIENGRINLKEHFNSEYGRLRELAVGPDGMLYVTTSNRDGRGNPFPADDRVIRINPEKL